MKNKIIVVVISIVAAAAVGVGSSLITKSMIKPEVVTVTNESDDDPYYNLIHKMVNEPEKYFGKTVTLEGYYSNTILKVTDDTSSDTSSSSTSSDTSSSSVSSDTSSDASSSSVSSDASSSSTEEQKHEKVYHFITVFDKYKDCYQTIEIDTEDTNYPDIGSYITVTGTYHKFMDSNGQHYSIGTDKFGTIS